MKERLNDRKYTKQLMLVNELLLTSNSKNSSFFSHTTIEFIFFIVSFFFLLWLLWELMDGWMGDYWCLLVSHSRDYMNLLAFFWTYSNFDKVNPKKTLKGFTIGFAVSDVLVSFMWILSNWIIMLAYLLKSLEIWIF